MRRRERPDERERESGEKQRDPMTHTCANAGARMDLRARVAHPLIGLLVTIVILHITWHPSQTVRSA